MPDQDDWTLCPTHGLHRGDLCPKCVSGLRKLEPVDARLLHRDAVVQVLENQVHIMYALANLPGQRGNAHRHLSHQSENLIRALKGIG